MRETLPGVSAVVVYYLICATAALGLRKTVHLPDEVFRKLLHCILLGSLLLWLRVFPQWWQAAAGALVFALAVYPLLCLAERLPGYSRFVTERRPGELKASLLLVFAMFAAVIAVCWGWLGERLLALAAVYAWGFGDAAAALVGRRFGRHALAGPHIEGRKSVEGSLAMFVTSGLCVLAIIALRGGLAWYGYLLIPLLTAAVATLVELFSLRGLDTVTCPLAAVAVLLPLTRLCGSLG